MTSGLGVDPTKNGSVVTSGTTSQDIQQIFGGLYTPGLVSGGSVTTNPSAMTYTVASGVAIVQMAAGLNVPIPIPAQTVSAPNVPVGGSRTDIVYAQQRTPAIDGDSNVIVNVATVLPPRSVALKSFTQPAGANNSAAGAVTGSVNYVIPYGATLGRLWYYQHKISGNLPYTYTRVGTATIYLPTDRMITFKVCAVLSAAGGYCEYGFLGNYDGGDFVLWSTPPLTPAKATFMFESTITLPAGSHTVSLGLTRVVGPGTGQTLYGTDPNGYGRNGIEFSVIDAGVVV